MGYRGKLAEREAARGLRAEGLTLEAVAIRLGVSRSSVSQWVRDVEFVPCPGGPARTRAPNSLQRRKAAEIEVARLEAARQLGVMGEQAFLAAGAALYAGEGAKADGDVRFANSDPGLVAFFCAWLRCFFSIDESRDGSRLSARGARPGGGRVGMVGRHGHPAGSISQGAPGCAAVGAPDHQARARLRLRALLLRGYAPEDHGSHRGFANV